MRQLFIDTTWSSNLAYIVGLLTTDGNLSKDGRHITFRSSDMDLLSTFSRCLSLKNKISPTKHNGYATRPSFRIQFSNVIFYRWLIQIGLTPKKSLTLGTIKIPTHYFIDFLRGHLDGDGTILIYKDRYNIYKGRNYTNQRLYLKFISASKEHLLWLNAMIKKTTGLHGTISCNLPKGKSNNIWIIKFSKKKSCKLLSLIYYKPDIPCLKRKMIVAIQILEQIKQEERKKYERIILPTPVTVI